MERPPSSSDKPLVQGPAVPPPPPPPVVTYNPDVVFRRSADRFVAESLSRGWFGHEWASHPEALQGYKTDRVDFPRLVVPGTGPGLGAEIRSTLTFWVAGHGRWIRAWGGFTFGGGLATPYFGVRIRGVTQASTGAMMIGVSSQLCQPDARPDAWGVDASSLGLVCAEEHTFDTGRQNSRDLATCAAAIGTTALSGVIKSNLLSTDRITGVSVPEGVKCACGFRRQDTTIGVVCDLPTNSIRFYIDDEIVRKTPDHFAETDKTQFVDSHLKAGQPFVWANPSGLDLAKAYPYVALFDLGATFELVDWIPPDLTPALATQIQMLGVSKIHPR